ncbi:hypothetical protein TGAM01_v205814 [Trichoderma gamsii]|uniref:Uncharacterized protein n=1 Tax=Trichoderma gamsii TaxID=398673 RepID=A0A2P4ZMK3_9HYPO|nr:hypothetical protein TGAM01_v205814 [Trichoderma gamsii]PON25520.1 hypothetical protein TGAM01_v205814 [Trichoderma gamsii]
MGDCGFPKRAAYHQEQMPQKMSRKAAISIQPLLQGLRHTVCRILRHDARENMAATSPLSIINQPVRMRRALLGFLSLAVAHKDMDEYKWQGILVSKEVRSSLWERERHGVLSREDVCGLLHGVLNSTT